MEVEAELVRRPSITTRFGGDAQGANNNKVGLAAPTSNSSGKVQLEGIFGASAESAELFAERESLILHRPTQTSSSAQPHPGLGRGL